MIDDDITKPIRYKPSGKSEKVSLEEALQFGERVFANESAVQLQDLHNLFEQLLATDNIANDSLETHKEVLFTVFT